jgi:hypothetical protein
MATQMVTVLRRTFDDWHHEHCDGRCGKAYCRDHRRLYWQCQDLKPVSSRMYCDEPPYTTMWEGEGECLICRQAAEMEKYRHWSEELNRSQAKVF